MCYNEFTLDELIDFCLEQAKLKQEKNSRRMVIGCGKPGVLEYLKSVYRQAGMLDDDIANNIKIADDEMKDGIYTIDSSCLDNLGIKYCGVK